MDYQELVVTEKACVKNFGRKFSRSALVGLALRNYREEIEVAEK